MLEIVVRKVLHHCYCCVWKSKNGGCCFIKVSLERETKLVYGRGAFKPPSAVGAGEGGESTAYVAIVRAGEAVGGSVRAKARAVTAAVYDE